VSESNRQYAVVMSHSSLPRLVPAMKLIDASLAPHQDSRTQFTWYWVR